MVVSKLGSGNGLLSEAPSHYPNQWFCELDWINFGKNYIKIYNFSWKKMLLKISFARFLIQCVSQLLEVKWRIYASVVCVGKLYNRWFRWLLVARSVPRHYLNLCRRIFNKTIGNKFGWNMYQITIIFIYKTYLWKCHQPNGETSMCKLVYPRQKRRQNSGR